LLLFITAGCLTLSSLLPAVGPFDFSAGCITLSSLLFDFSAGCLTLSSSLPLMIPLLLQI
jgi:hypothetical protein